METPFSWGCGDCFELLFITHHTNIIPNKSQIYAKQTPYKKYKNTPKKHFVFSGHFIKKLSKNNVLLLADREGFEPPEDLHPQQFSRLPH